MDKIDGKIESLRSLITKKGSLAVGLSGGLDSCFLSFIAQEMLNRNFIAIRAVGNIFPKSEKVTAENFCDKFNVRRETFNVCLEDIPLFKDNPVDRCYYCKNFIFKRIIELANANEFEIIADGSNVDDADDYRPGQKAINELGVISPLRECGFTKKEIIIAAGRVGLSEFIKPSSPCLASRIPYGEEVTLEKLERVEQAEDFIHSTGINECRVRHVGNVARIEVGEDEVEKVISLRRQISVQLKQLGFLYVSLDLEPFKTGRLNIDITKKMTS
jgi:uncharacterized protein